MSEFVPLIVIIASYNDTAANFSLIIHNVNDLIILLVNDQGINNPVVINPLSGNVGLNCMSVWSKLLWISFCIDNNEDFHDIMTLPSNSRIVTLSRPARNEARNQPNSIDWY